MSKQREGGAGRVEVIKHEKRSQVGSKKFEMSNQQRGQKIRETSCIWQQYECAVM